MPIDLTEFERGAPFPGDFPAALAQAQERLARLQLAQIVHRRRTIIIFEGWMGVGKTSLRHLVGSLDPCHVTTRSTAVHRDDDDDRHWLAPFWGALPQAGDTTVFFRSWYVRLVRARLIDEQDADRFARMCDEINEFEAQQRDHGTQIIKLFFHLSADRHAELLAANEADPWKQHLVTRIDRASVERRADLQSIIEDMFAQTDTRWAKWQVIDSNDRQAAVLATLGKIADALEKALPGEPPGESETVVAFRQQRMA